MSNGQEDIGKKLPKYRGLTKKALGKVALNKGNSPEQDSMAKKLLEMADLYYNDAQYFEGKGMHLTALAAYSYAHAWIDAGVRLGILDGKGDDRLFVLP
ncbi:MAG TPA: DUF357 domain-containing protein [Candidatus Diapherotrites archaeon]|uniref:DUF357 domain-containing protein n=1 Tax=Candidatus Iainarchaeum sp. TaxID=3101447 RepID=A0A7J4IYC1_9ARCH|nr:DUF357 domain-containing protein [Candidatus Diapherotrites archaeon]